jgi:hypothetical protein
MKTGPQQRPRRLNPNLPKQALIPRHPKILHLQGHQLANPADLQLVAVVLDETNIRKIGTRTEMEMPGIWRIPRAAASPTKSAETLRALDTAESTAHISTAASRGDPASHATCTRSEPR